MHTYTRYLWIGSTEHYSNGIILLNCFVNEHGEIDPGFREKAY